MVKAPFRDSYILPQKLLSFTDIYPNTQGQRISKRLGHVVWSEYLFVG